MRDSQVRLGNAHNLRTSQGQYRQLRAASESDPDPCGAYAARDNQLGMATIKFAVEILYSPGMASTIQPKVPGLCCGKILGRCAVVTVIGILLYRLLN